MPLLKDTILWKIHTLYNPIALQFPKLLHFSFPTCTRKLLGNLIRVSNNNTVPQIYLRIGLLEPPLPPQLKVKKLSRIHTGSTNRHLCTWYVNAAWQSTRFLEFWGVANINKQAFFIVFYCFDIFEGCYLVGPDNSTTQETQRHILITTAAVVQRS